MKTKGRINQAAGSRPPTSRYTDFIYLVNDRYSCTRATGGGAVGGGVVVGGRRVWQLEGRACGSWRGCGTVGADHLNDHRKT